MKIARVCLKTTLLFKAESRDPFPVQKAKLASGNTWKKKETGIGVKGKEKKKGEDSESPGVTSPVSFPNTGTEATDTGDRLGSDGRKDDCCRVLLL